MAHVLTGVEGDERCEASDKQHPQNCERVDVEREVGDKALGGFGTGFEVQPVEGVNVQNGSRRWTHEVLDERRQRCAKAQREQAHRDERGQLAADLEGSAQRNQHERQQRQERDGEHPRFALRDRAGRGLGNASGRFARDGMSRDGTEDVEGLHHRGFLGSSG